MTIKKIGGYLTVDKDGYLIPDVSSRNIPPHWQELILTVTGFAEKNSAIMSIYLRGSVPRGLAVDGVSDLDMATVIKEGAALPKVTEFEKELLQAFPFCENIEWGMRPLNDFRRVMPPQTLPVLAVQLKTQALHSWGDDFIKDFPRVKPGLNTLSHVFSFETDWRKYPAWLEQARTQADIDRECAWMGKRMLRLAFELAAIDKPKFTRDLYFCYETAAEEYPEIKDPLHAVLDLTIHQDATRAKVMETFSPVADFLIEKKKRLRF